jgi:tRNA G18 (ribose-2'-O)-methylase SpoU
VIESDANPFYKGLKKVLSGRGVRKYGSTIASGAKVVDEVLRRSPQLCEAWLSAPSHGSPPPQLPGETAWYRLTPSLFGAIDLYGTGEPLLLIRTPEMAPWRPADGLQSGCTLLLPFQDPENVGAVIRSAVAFGVERVVVLAECAHPYHPKSLRASAGVVVHANLLEGPALADLPADLPVTPLSPQGRDIDSVTFDEAFALLPGLEGPGLPDHLRSRAVSIPVSGAVESLNAATAVAIALYSWRRRSG